MIFVTIIVTVPTNMFAYNIFVTFLRFLIVYSDNFMFSMNRKRRKENTRESLKLHKTRLIQLCRSLSFFCPSRGPRSADLWKENKSEENGWKCDDVTWSQDISVNACKLIIQFKLIYNNEWQVQESCASVSWIITAVGALYSSVVLPGNQLSKWVQCVSTLLTLFRILRTSIRKWNQLSWWIKGFVKTKCQPLGALTH